MPPLPPWPWHETTVAPGTRNRGCPASRPLSSCVPESRKGYLHQFEKYSDCGFFASKWRLAWKHRTQRLENSWTKGVHLFTWRSLITTSVSPSGFPVQIGDIFVLPVGCLRSFHINCSSFRNCGGDQSERTSNACRTPSASQYWRRAQHSWSPPA